jgi:hypothetical protein
MNPLVKWLMKVMTKPKEIRAGLLSSIHAAYVTAEIESILEKSNLRGCQANKVIMGLVISGEKAG